VGGDEWLSGSRTYYADELAKWHWQSLYDCFRADVSAFGVKNAAKWFIRHGCFPFLPHKFQSGLQKIVRKVRGIIEPNTYWLTPNMQDKIRLRRDKFSSERSQSVYRFSQNELFCTRNDAYLGIAREEAENRYARFGLEVRRPLHTAEFVQFAFSTPERLRLYGDIDKYIHVQALQSLMPQEILERRTKAEFSVMFREHLDHMKEVYTVTLPRKRADWITRDGMKQLYKHYQENPQLGWPLWILWSIYGCDRLLRQMGKEYY